MRALLLMRSRSALVTMAVTATVYVCAAKFGFTMAFTAEQVTLVWPPTGFALAILLAYGTAAWPGVFIGAFLANATAHEPLAIAACIATGNTLEAVVGTYLLRRYTGLGDSLDRLRHALGLVVFGALAGTTISPTIGVASLCVAAIQPWTAYGQLWWTWWLGDAAGALLIAPALLTLGADPAPYIVVSYQNGVGGYSGTRDLHISSQGMDANETRGATEKKDGELWRRSRLRQVKYLNNIVEQDHRNVKRLTRPGLGFGGFWTARRTLAGYEAMAMISKGQIRNIDGREIKAQARFIASLFEATA